MAVRPAWTLTNKVEKKFFSFKWNGGFAISQKKKNIINLHKAMQQDNCNNILEVSTKSDDEFGQNLSAFKLKLQGYYLENIFQSSKVYENGGPYLDLLNVEPKNAKRDIRHSNSGNLKGFFYNNNLWKLEPKTAFYDYIYALAIRDTIDMNYLKKICKYDWFTDIEFNSNKSVNCQARSAALIKYIVKNDNWEVLESVDLWIKFHEHILGEGA